MCIKHELNGFCFIANKRPIIPLHKPQFKIVHFSRVLDASWMLEAAIRWQNFLRVNLFDFFLFVVLC